MTNLIYQTYREESITVEESTIILHNNRQEQFYRDLSKRRYTSAPPNLFDDMTVALDFMQGWMKVRSEGPTDTWNGEMVLNGIREQVLSWDSDRLLAFCHAITMDQYGPYFDGGGVLLPFYCKPGDTATALRHWELILSTAIQEDMFIKGLNNVWILIPLLLMQQKNFHLWSTLVEAVQKGNTKAISLFYKFMFLVSMSGRPFKFASNETSETQWMQETGNELRFLNYLYHYVDDEKVAADGKVTNPLILPVPKFQVFACSRAVDRWKRKSDKQLTAHSNLLAWFGAYEADFARAAEWMWQEISTDAKYGLRPGGKDMVKIQIKALRDVGHRFIQLIPQETFPLTIARNWMILPTVDIRLATDRLLDSPGFKQGYEPDAPTSERALGDKLGYFISIHSLWRIVTGRAFKVKPKQTKSGESQRRELERTLVAIRPHFRWLVPGYNASDIALSRSMEHFGYTPPEGKTFVKSHLQTEAGVSLPGAEPSTVFTYTAEDLGYED